MAPELERGTRRLQISLLFDHSSQCTGFTCTIFFYVYINEVQRSLQSSPLLNLGSYLQISREDSHKGQVQGGVHRQTAAGAGEGVSEQPLHHHAQEGGAVVGTGPLWKTGEAPAEFDHFYSLERAQARLIQQDWCAGDIKVTAFITWLTISLDVLLHRHSMLVLVFLCFLCVIFLLTEFYVELFYGSS